LVKDMHPKVASIENEIGEVSDAVKPKPIRSRPLVRAARESKVDVGCDSECDGRRG
jgi:hypothetical protein